MSDAPAADSGDSGWLTAAGIGSIIGGIGSAFSGYKETKRGHRWSSREAEKTREFNAQQAALNRDFQERMASTQFTRSAADLERAGLNRILALGKPAAAATGSAATSSTPGNPGVKSIGEAGIRSASAVAQIDQIRAQEQLLKSQANLTDETSRKTSAEADMTEVKRFMYSVLQNILGEDGSSARLLADQIKGFLGLGPELPEEESWWDKLKKSAQDQRNSNQNFKRQGGGGGR